MLRTASFPSGYAVKHKSFNHRHMNKFVKILLWISGILLILIGILCYKIGHNAFTNYLYFLVPMALIRLAHSILLILTPSKQ